MKTQIQTAFTTLIAGWLPAVLIGCAGTDLVSWNKKDALVRAEADNPVVEVLTLWQPGEGTGTNGLPTRGFGGQIFFFTRNSPTPALVDGKVRVYLFDDQGTPEEQARPLHQFDFESNAWQTHAVKTTLGPAYQVFIPYIRKETHRAECALRVRLQPEDGPLTFSNTVKVTLPGTTPTNNEAKSNQTVSNDVGAAQTLIREKLATLTLPVPTNDNKTSPLSQPIREPNKKRSAVDSEHPLIAAPPTLDDTRMQRVEEMLRRLRQSQPGELDQSIIPQTQPPARRRFQLTPANPSGQAPISNANPDKTEQTHPLLIAPRESIHPLAQQTISEEPTSTSESNTEPHPLEHATAVRENSEVPQTTEAKPSPAIAKMPKSELE